VSESPVYKSAPSTRSLSTHKHLELPSGNIGFLSSLHHAISWTNADLSWIRVYIINKFQSNILRDSQIFYDKNATLFDIFFGISKFCRCLRDTLSAFATWARFTEAGSIQNQCFWIDPKVYPSNQRLSLNYWIDPKPLIQDRSSFCEPGISKYNIVL